MFLSGYFVGSGSSGIRTSSNLLKAVRQQYSPRLYWAAEIWYSQAITFPSETRLTKQGPDCAPRHVWAKITGPTCLRSSIATQGLGPWLSEPGALPCTRGQG